MPFNTFTFYIYKAVYTSYQLAKKYLAYYATASNAKGHGMHSPFVFQFIKKVLNNKDKMVPPSSIEALRKELLSNKKDIQIKDLGAGSRLQTNAIRKISTLARRDVKPKKYGQLLYRLAHYYQPKTIIELGTSLGITTAYLAAANEGAEVYTVEGSPSIHNLAVDNFNLLNFKNIDAIEGNFDTVLPRILEKQSRIDLAYVDGNHRLKPTLHYFELLLTKAHNDTIFVFDDIHWSAEMEEAWESIKNNEAVTATIDLFFIGIVLLRNEFKTKQHFKVYF